MPHGEIKPCPFCLHDKQLFSSEKYNFTRIKCLNCNMTGPSGHNLDDEVQAVMMNFFRIA